MTMSGTDLPSTPLGSKKKNASATDRNDGPPAKKFQRVYRACNRCRNKKEKCDGVQPSCSACSSAKQPCIYQSGVRKRGLPQGYVRVLEMLLGSILSSLEDSEEALKKLLDRLCLESEADWRLTVLERWKSSTLVKDIERFLPTLDVPDERDIINKGLKRSESVSLGLNRTTEVSSATWRLPSSDLLDLVPVMSNSSDNRSFARPSVATDIGQWQETFPASEALSGVTYQDSPENAFRSPNALSHLVQRNPAPPIEKSTTLLRLNLPTKAWRLFDIFFAYTNPWLCAINKVDILRIAYTYSAQPLELSRHANGTGTHAALWAVLACASRQVSTNMSDSPQVQSLLDPDWTTDQLYDTARRLIPEEEEQYETGHVQALLLLSLCKIGTRQWPSAWLLIGHAVRVALILDLQNSSAAQTSYSGGDQERRKHVFLGCFILDTLIAAQMKKLPHLRTEIVRRVGLIPENDLEEWNPWLAPSELNGQLTGDTSQRRPTHAGSTFNQLVKIVCILNDIICLSPYMSFSQDQYQTFSQSLQEWNMVLPSHCQIGTTLENITSVIDSPLPHILGLQLLHLTTYAYLELRMPQGTRLASKTIFGSGLSTATVCVFHCFQMYGALAVPPAYTITAQVVMRHAEVFSTSESDVSRVALSETMSRLDRLWSGSAVVEQPQKPFEQVTGSATGDRLTTEIPRIAMGNFSQPHDAMQYNTQYGLMEYMNQTANSEATTQPQWSHSYDTTQSMMNIPSLLQNSSENNMTLPAFDPLSDQGLQFLVSDEIDSLLDELAALDSTEMADRQSQFLRNFGYGPDVWQQEMPDLNTG